MAVLNPTASATAPTGMNEPLGVLLRAAHRLARLGYPVFPVKGGDKAPATPHGFKDATTDSVRITALFRERHNLGVLPPARVLVLDCDGAQTASELEAQHPELRSAPKARTPRGGAHFWLRLPEGAKPIPTRAGALPQVDVRGFGKAYVVAPPSRRADGAYAWQRELVPQRELPVASDGLLRALRSSRTASSAVTPTVPVSRVGMTYGRAALEAEAAHVQGAAEGTRNDTLNTAAFRLGQLVTVGELDEITVTTRLLAASAACGLPHDEALSTLRSGLRAGAAKPRASQRSGSAPTPLPATIWERPLDPATDRANAERLAALWSPRITYTPGMGWLAYEDGVFHHKTEHELLALAQEDLPRQVYTDAAEFSRQASASSGERERKELVEQAELLLKWGKRCEMRRTLVDALALLKGRVTVPPTAWDTDPWLLNVENGVLELRTQTLRGHRPEDHMTKQAPVCFDPVARHPAVDALLELLRRDGRAEFLQRAFGSSLIGIVKNEVLLYLVGAAGTGKSTLAEALLATLGPYATTVDTRTFLDTGQHRPDGPRSDLLKLRGARLAIGRELPKNGRLNAADIKALTGRDTITARAPYAKEPVDFTPQFKLAVHSNFDLQADWDDPGVRRRLLRIPFNAKPLRPDPTIKDALQSDPAARSAILNWLLAGAAMWIAAQFRLDPPAVVTDATRAYWHEQDPFAEWAELHLDFDGATLTPTADLYQNYKRWAEREGIRPQGRKSLGKWLAQRPGLISQRTSTARGWHGVRLKGTIG